MSRFFGSVGISDEDYENSNELVQIEREVARDANELWLAEINEHLLAHCREYYPEQDWRLNNDGWDFDSDEYKSRGIVAHSNADIQVIHEDEPRCVSSMEFTVWWSYAHDQFGAGVQWYVHHDTYNGQSQALIYSNAYCDTIDEAVALAKFRYNAFCARAKSAPGVA
jgi:hypothetical protein